jgi:hypothetical protein
MLNGFGPIDLNFSTIRKAVAQVQINEALIRHADLIGHTFEILHNVF